MNKSISKVVSYIIFLCLTKFVEKGTNIDDTKRTHNNMKVYFVACLMILI